MVPQNALEMEVAKAQLNLKLYQCQILARELLHAIERLPQDENLVAPTQKQEALKSLRFLESALRIHQDKMDAWL